ncbi:trypsin-like peptidase domain-containing protein, partial [Singulisphaera rosea]
MRDGVRGPSFGVCLGVLFIAASVAFGSTAEAYQDEGAESRGLGEVVVKRCKSATALVELIGRGTGSAAYISAGGFFVTNQHVVATKKPGDKVRLILDPSLKTERTLDAVLVKIDPEIDLALLKADAPKGLVPLSIGADEALFETMPITAFGFPFGRMLAEGAKHP